MTVDLLAPLAHRIAARRFNLDDVRAKIGEQARGEWGGNKMAQLKYVHAAQQRRYRGLRHKILICLVSGQQRGDTDHVISGR
jgi:hypothetical protein